MSRNPQSPPLRRSYSSVPFVTSRQHATHDSWRDETSPLLPQTRDPILSGDGPTHSTSNSPTNAVPHDPTRSPELYTRHHSRAGSLRRFLTQTLGREQRHGHRTLGTPLDAAFHHGLYDQFTSIDFMSETISDATRQRDLQARKTLSGKLKARFYDAQGWILAALVGIITAAVTYLIDIFEGALFDAKFGYCSKTFFTTRKQCCSNAANCREWIPWGQAISSRVNIQHLSDFGLYMAFMVILTMMSCLLVLADKHVIRPPRPGAYVAKGSAEVRRSSTTEQREIVLYPSAGSGVAEVKVICSGFIIHGFLGAKTLLIKSAACVLSVASGLSIGKEGPYVHIAACIGNVVSRFFPKYDANAGKRREIISASSAAGIAVAFGAPISGVVFSLEEVSYYFPATTFFRTFFCSIIAAVSLKFLNPYLTNKIVPFEVTYKSDWRAFEMPLFVVLGVLGGAVGAIFVKGTRLWSRSFRSLSLIKKRPLVEALIIALVSGMTGYWNRYTKLPIGELMFELASSCSNVAESGTGLCPSADEIPTLIGTLGTAFLVKSVLTMITFGVKVPAGIYVPSMVIGGLLGRAVGHAIQYTIILMGSEDGGLFGICSSGGTLEGCIVPGVYALITAGATMCGVTRLSFTLALILFELTGSLDHVLPFSIAVLTAKWTADLIEPQSIYDLYMEMNAYPYLDNKSRPNLSGELADFTPRITSGRTIDISNSPLMKASLLRSKLDFLVETGQFDGGLPILKNNVLVGIIPCLDLAFCLDRLKDRDDELCVVSPHVNSQDFDQDDVDAPSLADLTDFSAFIDPAPLTLDIHTNFELIYECFVKLGLRYVCVCREGQFVGLVHKKAFIRFARGGTYY